MGCQVQRRKKGLRRGFDEVEKFVPADGMTEGLGIVDCKKEEGFYALREPQTATGGMRYTQFCSRRGRN